jgi:hypothetical protein
MTSAVDAALVVRECADDQACMPHSCQNAHALGIICGDSGDVHRCGDLDSGW